MKKIFTFILMIFAIVLINPTIARAEANVPFKVVMDKDLLLKPIVAANEVEITAKIYDSDNRYCYGYEVVYSIVSGNEFASIVDNKLLVTDVGEFTIRCTVKNTNVYEDYQTQSYSCKLSDIMILNKFENITVYTQPIKLQSSISVSVKNSLGKTVQSNDSHFLTKYRVISGPAEIYLDCYLRILGVGEVVIEASSLFDDSVRTTKSFTVTNPDEGKEVDDDTIFYQGEVLDNENNNQGENQQTQDSGCQSNINIGLIILALITTSTVLLTVRKKENRYQ